MTLALAPIAFTAPNIATAAERDPIFDAIDAHRAANQEFMRALDELEHVEESLPVDLERRPGIHLGAMASGQALVIRSYADIEAILRIARQNMPPKMGVVIPKEGLVPIHRMTAEERAEEEAARQRLRKDLAATVAAHRDRQRASGWRAAKIAELQTAREERSRAWALSIEMPQTLAGAAALMRYISEERRSGNLLFDEEQYVSVVATLAEALPSIAKAA